MSFQHVPYEQLIAYAARELSDADFAPHMAHLRECSECVTTIKRFRAILNVVRDDFVPTPPVSAIARAKHVFNSTPVAPMPTLALPRGLTAWMPALRRFSFSTAVMLVLILVSFILGGTSAIAARDAIPGDILYPVKISVEGLQITATADPVRQAELRMLLLEKRTDEITQLVELGRAADVAQGTAALESQMVQTIALVEQVSQRDPARGQVLGEQVNQILVQNEQKLKNVAAAAPTSAKPAIQKALSVMEQNQVTIKERTIPERPTPTPVPLPTPTATPNRPQTFGSSSSSSSAEDANASRDVADKDNNKDKSKDETARETREPRPKAGVDPTATAGNANDKTANPAVNAPGQSKTDEPGNSDKDKNPPGQNNNGNPPEPPKPRKSK